MQISWKFADETDLLLLAEWNYQLIRDEGHRNAMTVEQLGERMKGWLKGEYKAVIFHTSEPLAYALFKEDGSQIYLRQFFVRRDRRRAGIGAAAFKILRESLWPKSMRLTVEVLCSNESAVAFWHSMGYQDYSLTLEIMPK